MDPNLAASIAQYLGFRMDSNETAMLSRQLEHIKSSTYDVKYPAFKARQFIPLASGTPSGAETITYRQWDQYGMAKVISNFADDLPSVDVVAKEFTSRVKSLGDNYQYSIQDLRAAALAGNQLDAKRAVAARRAIEASIDNIAAIGLPEAGMEGFVNNSNVPLIAPTTGSWASATAAQILADMNKLVKSVVVATKQIHQPDTLLMDVESFELIAGLPTGTELTRTVLKVFLETNPHIRNIDSWYMLDTADAAGTGPRMIAYARDAEVLELEVPQEFEQLPPQSRNLAFVVPCHARIGGTVIRYPLGLAYMDGI